MSCSRLGIGRPGESIRIGGTAAALLVEVEE